MKFQRKMINQADKWFSIFIRLRDSDENGYCKCITCGKMLFWRNMDNGHFVKRQHAGTRFHEKNCHAQCRNCNWPKQGNDYEYTNFIINTYGNDTLNILKSAERQASKHSALELKLISKEYQQKAKELSKFKGIEI